MSRRNQWLGYFFVILSAVIFGCMPLGANFLYAQGVTPMSLVFLRNLLSLPLLALLGSRQGGLRIGRDALREVGVAAFSAAGSPPLCCSAPIAILPRAWRRYSILPIPSSWCSAAFCCGKR